MGNKSSTVEQSQPSAALQRELLIYGFIGDHRDTMPAGTAIPDEVKQLCVDYWGGIIFDTKILTLQEEAMLHTLLEAHCEEEIEATQYRLLYRASQHAFSAAKYHDACDNERNLVVVVHNEHNHVFGGFRHDAFYPDKITMNFETTNPDEYAWRYDRLAMLFLLRSPSVALKSAKKYPPAASSRTESTTYCDMSSGPCFGNHGVRWDPSLVIGISDRCHEVPSYSQTGPGHGYKISRNNELCGGDVNEQEMQKPKKDRKYEYLVREYEVFKIAGLNLSSTYEFYETYCK